jgi:hypothetical protein
MGACDVRGVRTATIAWRVRILIEQLADQPDCVGNQPFLRRSAFHFEVGISFCNGGRSGASNKRWLFSLVKK